MKKTFLERFCDSPAKTGASLWTHRRANKHVEERTIIEVEIVILSEALLASQPRGEQTSPITTKRKKLGPKFLVSKCLHT